MALHVILTIGADQEQAFCIPVDDYVCHGINQNIMAMRHSKAPAALDMCT